MMWERLPGGPDVIRWFGGAPNFQSAELIELNLHRDRGCRMRVSTMVSRAGPQGGPPFKHAVFTFHLRDVAAVSMQGFGPQNIIGGLSISSCPPRDAHPSLYGIGMCSPDHRLTLEPCAGAFGTIDATVWRITVEDVADYQAAV